MDTGTSWKVLFANSSGQYYYKSYRDLKVIEDPLEIHGSIDYHGRHLHYFRAFRFGNLVKVFCENGHQITDDIDDFTIEPYAANKGRTINPRYEPKPEPRMPVPEIETKQFMTTDSRERKILDYYLAVLEKEADSEETSFLYNQFSALSSIKKESVLSVYLNKTKPETYFFEPPYIAPFGINASQKDALSAAFKNQISIIQGPPGTGKTQTILNIIANAIVRGKTVAMTSNNNYATDNVLDKLKSYGLDFLAAPLGNVDNVDRFFESYSSEVPNLKKEKVNSKAIDNFFLGLSRYFDTEKKKEGFKQNLLDLELEYKHFLADHEDAEFLDFELVDPTKVMAALVYFGERKIKRLSWLRKLLLKWRFGLPTDLIVMEPEERALNLQNLYYKTRILDTKAEIMVCEQQLEGHSFAQKMQDYTEQSMAYLRNYLHDNFTEQGRRNFQKEEYKRQFAEFTKAYPVVLSTTHSLARCSRKGFLFDYLIVDEASQADMASAVLSMSMAKNLIIVGDSKQLPQIDDSRLKDINESLLTQLGIEKGYSYLGQSLLTGVKSLFGSSVPEILLREHYRCDPSIIGFCNQEFYSGKLLVCTSPREDDSPSIHLLKTVPGNHARKSPDGKGWYNQREIDEITELIKTQNLTDVGVIAPYHCQAEYLAKALPIAECSTVHKFQGREKENIIFSATANDANDFVNDPNLINVAVSRAKRGFYLVVSDKFAKANSGPLANLVRYIRYHSEFAEEKEGKVHSIYDLLYEEYRKEMGLYFARHRNKDFPSELVTEKALADILKEKPFRSLRYAMHVSLRDFVRGGLLPLTAEESRFYKNPLSHIDFLVYQSFDKSPVLAIEVDGIAYHEKNQVQSERDALKNSILAKAGIPLLRLKTNQSQERDRIVASLNHAIQ